MFLQQLPMDFLDPDLDPKSGSQARSGSRKKRIFDKLKWWSELAGKKQLKFRHTFELLKGTWTMADPCLIRSLHSLHRLLNLAHKSFHSEMPLVVNSSFVPNSKICPRVQPDALLPQRTVLPRFPASVAQSALTSKHW